MLGTILAIVLILAIVGSVVGAVLFRSKKRYNNKFFVACVSVAAACCALFLTVPFSIHTVEPGQVAVVKVWGDAKYVRSPGTYFDFWISNEYAIYDTTVQQEDISTMCYSSDAQTMDVNIVVQYQIQSEKAIQIANNYGGLERLSQRIQSVSIDKAKTVLSKKSAMNIIETRASVSPDIEAAIKQTVQGDYYVDIVTVVITNIDFSDAFEATVEDKMIAEQQQLKAKYEKEKAIIEAEKELEVAKLAAQANIAKAEGDAEAVRVKALAEANAIKLKSLEVARMLGFTVIADEETSTEEVTNYVIDFTGKTDAEIKVISDYLKYVEYLEVWDGKLPNVIGGDSANVYVPVNPQS
ncbi:MAG: prohibitin family protein [Corallococcus sp.]|nr:prohibitin family protein [Bacillota bacterium]MCM1533241.1 prohibitin family protein [Corallococcus sp.]